MTQLFASSDISPVNIIHPSANIAADTQIGIGVSIEANVVIGKSCVLGDRATIAANSTVGDYCNIGEDTLLKAHVVLANKTQIGKRVIIQPGAIIGGDGFGFVPDGDDWV